MIEPGAGQSVGWGFTSTAPRFFLKLRYTDAPTADPFNDDFDGDGVSNWEELLQGTDPFHNVDSDGNGLPDDWEIRYFGHIGVDPNADEDGDGLTNLQEFQLHVDPTDSCNSKVGAGGDSDNNGLADWWETLHFGHLGNDPSQIVAGKGGLTLKQIFDGGLDLTASSTVGDGIPDSWKVAHGLDANSLTAMNEDPDGDGLTNADEYAAGTDPMNWDTDGDYVPDGQDMAPLVANPVDPDHVRIDVPSWDTLSQQPNFDPAQVDYTAIQVRWDAADRGGSATGYRIEKRVDSNPWVELATVGTGTTSQADQGLIASRQYQYRVIAIVDSGNTHVESAGVTTSYQVPLGLRLAAKQSTSFRGKADWAFREFTNPPSLAASVPPAYYLCRTSTGTNTKTDGSSTSNDPWTSTTIYGSSDIKTNAPAQHTRTIITSDDYDYSYDAPSTGPASSEYIKKAGDHATYHSYVQGWGKTQTATSQIQYGNRTESNSSGEVGSVKDSSTSTGGKYTLSGTFQATAGAPRWDGSGFDLANGRVSYTGTSTWYTPDWDGYSSSATTNDRVTWTGTATTTKPSKTYPISAPEYTGSPINGIVCPRGDITGVDHTTTTYGANVTAGNQVTKASGSDVLSAAYDTPTFVQDTINDLPDYPAEWDPNFYGWGYQGWDGYAYQGDWYPHGSSWNGWWVGERHLNKDEDLFKVAKMKYKFTANPSAPTTLKWYEVFVPDDDPSTPDVDESKNIQIIAERTWTLGAGQNECPEYEVDPTTRQDGNGYYTLLIEPAHLSTPELGEAGKDVAGSETDPGKVVLVNDGDADGDGVPDYGDGYRLHAGIDQEAESPATTFTPLQVNWAAADPQRTRIRFTYDASDPLGVTRAGPDLYVLPGAGKLRLWRKDGGQARDGHDANQGGDFIKPGVEYSLRDLGIDPEADWDGGMTVYVEAVKTSAGVADLPVKVEIDPTGSSGFPWSDQLRFTATKIELRGKQYGEEGFSPVNRLVNSTLDRFDPTVQAYDMTPASFEVERVRLYDPRATAVTRVKVGGVYLPVTRNGSYLETGDFVCVRPGTAAPAGWSGTATLLPMAGGSIQIEYNPFSLWDWVSGFFRSPDQSKEVQTTVDRITKELHDDQSWHVNPPYDPKDTGALGKETDKRLAAYFKNKPGWYTNVYVRTDTGEILSTGVPLDIKGLPQPCKELDLVYTKGGYKISTGPQGFLSGKPLEKLNKKGLLFAAEVKTRERISDALKAEIKKTYQEITGLEKVYLADSAYVYKGGLVVSNKVRLRKAGFLSLAGGAFIASAAIVNAASNIAEADATLDETIQVVIAKRKIFLDPSSNMYEAMAAKYAAADAINRWMKLAMPDDTFHNILSSALFYKFVLADTPANAIWEYDPDFDNGYDDPDPDEQ